MVDFGVVSCSLKPTNLPVASVGTDKHTLTAQTVVGQLGLQSEGETGDPNPTNHLENLCTLS